MIWLLLKVSSLYPEMSLVEMSRRILGKWLGTAVSLWYMYYFLISSAYLVREMGDFMTTTSLLLCLIVFMSLSVMGASLTKLTVYPTYFLAQLINIGNFVQRIEAIMATAWLLTIFFKTVIYMYAFTKGCAQTFGLRNFHSLILPAGVLLFGLAMEVSPNVEYYLKTILPYWIGWDTTNGIILPLLLLIVYGVRKKWTQSHSL